MSESRPFRPLYASGDEGVDGDEVAVRIVYGRRTEAVGDGLRVAMPVVGADALREVWRGGRIEGRGASGCFRYVRMHGGLLMGFAVAAEDAGLRDAARRVYRELLELARRQGCPHVVRVWNHFPDITGLEEGQGRYQRFCAGRREAILADAGAADFRPPAVTTTGTCAPGLAVYFLASRRPGRPLQNPRQVPPSE